MNFLLTIGEYSPIIIIFLGLLLQRNIFLTFLLLLDLVLINPSLKLFFDFIGLGSLRPICSSNNSKFNGILAKIRNLDKYMSMVPSSGYKCLGMPSGHTEINWIYLTYSYLLYKNFPSNINFWNLILAIVLTLITMWQRIITGKHSISQVIIGAIIGISIGWSFYSVSQSNNLFPYKKY